MIVGIGAFFLLHNYAQDAAQPVEAALIKEGAVKQCGRGDNGQGPDNRSPWYYAILEVPGNRQQAADTVHQAARESGFTLTNGPYPPNPKDNQFFSDKTSKASNYLGLKSGPVGLSVEVYGSGTYAGAGKLCTVEDNVNSPTNMTTVMITIGLPSF